MHDVLQYIREYQRQTDRKWLLYTTLFTAVLIFLNYQSAPVHTFRFQSWTGYFLLYIISYGLPFGLFYFLKKQPIPLKVLLVIVATAWLFSIRVSSTFILEYFRDDLRFASPYWPVVFYYPLNLLFLLPFIYWLWKLQQPGFTLSAVFRVDKKHYGLYISMLGIMVPLIFIAILLPSFHSYYPKYAHVDFPDLSLPRLFYIVIYEISYALDFISIELFFRGLLVIGMIRLAGPAAILPMAVFYCTVHFGKPAGECISSYFGGLLLGIISWKTRSIAGGLFVHIGIAWLMEIAGSVF